MVENWEDLHRQNRIEEKYFRNYYGEQYPKDSEEAMREAEEQKKNLANMIEGYKEIPKLPLSVILATAIATIVCIVGLGLLACVALFVLFAVIASAKYSVPVIVVCLFIIARIKSNKRPT